MIGDALVIDAVVHGYLMEPASPETARFSEMATATLYHGVHHGFQPRTGGWTLPEERFRHADDPDLLAAALFAESQNDLVVYHDVPAYGIWQEGGSPLRVGIAMRAAHPDRVALYGAVSPLQPGAVEEVDRLVDEVGVAGLKLYPMDLVDGRSQGWSMSDPEVCFPVLERARARGVRNIAIHKAIPFGPAPMDPFRVADVEGAASAFPDLTFEIVHGGFAFLEETAFLLQRYPNVVINLEGASAFLVHMPRKFAEVIGTFLQFGGGADRIVWATGCVALHPRPFIEAFWAFQMPADLTEGYGYPPLDDAAKRAILGENAARLLGLDAERLRAQATERGAPAALAEPWSAGRVAA